MIASHWRDLCALIRRRYDRALRHGTIVSLGAVAAGLVFASGCHRGSNLPEGRPPPNPSAPARYHPPAMKPSSPVSRLKMDENGDWRSAPFYVMETELSPATLVHSAGRYLGLFRRGTQYGLGSPTHVAWSTREGPRAFKNGAEIDVTNMEENWGLVWFAGAAGWNLWDSPWAFFLQHRPASMKLDGDGLHLTFSNRVGDVVLIPMYGAYKPPLPSNDILVQHGLAGHKIKTWEWGTALPRDPLIRLRFWARAARRFPIYCEDSFSVDRGRDSVTLRSSFDWYEIRDEWNTPPLSLVPISPVLGLVAKESVLPIKFSSPPFDLGMFTPYGPYFGIPDVQEFTATFSILQYINETETAGAPTNSEPVVAQAAARLRAAARQLMETARTDSTNARRPSISTNVWFARSLRYFDPATASNAVTVLQQAFSQPSAFALESADDPAAADVLKSLWAYADFTGDWDLVRKQWPRVEKLFHLGAQTRWASFGRTGELGLGQGMSMCIGFARLAYQAGDLDAYNYACAILARELVHDSVRLRGAEYFRQHQPISSMEFMEKPVYVAQLKAAGPGWAIDGPNYPKAAVDPLYRHRWQQFDDVDVGRYFQDYLGPHLRGDLDAFARELGTNTQLLVLRSLLLNQSPSRWAQWAGFGQDKAGSKAPADTMASAWAILRSSRAVRFERLISGDASTAFVAGPEREVRMPGLGVAAYLGVDSAGSGDSPDQPLDWPRLEWRPWKTSAGRPWVVGHIQPVRSGAPRRVTAVPLNWNTRVFVFDLP